MGQTITGKLVVGSERFAVLAARFNEFVTARLVAGAMDALRRHGASDGQIIEVWVPGAWELPAAAKALAESGRVDAVICVGCVIRGETPHHEYVAEAAARGIGQVALEQGVPVTFGVLTADTLEQAIERAGAKAGNKGADAACAAIEMLSVLTQIRALGKGK